MRDFARDGRDETRERETMPSPRAPSVCPLPVFCSCASVSIFFSLSFFYLRFFVASKGKRWLQFEAIIFVQKPFGKCAFWFFARAARVGGWKRGARHGGRLAVAVGGGVAVSEFWKESEGLFVIFRCTTSVSEFLPWFLLTVGKLDRVSCRIVSLHH